MTDKKVFTSEDIRRHLAAVRTLKHAGPVASLGIGQNGKFAAFGQGVEAVIQYVSKRFGVCLTTDCQTAMACQASHSLKTWDLGEVKAILKEVCQIMLQDPLFSSDQGTNETVFKEGMQKTILAIAISFGFKEFQGLR